MNQKRKGNLFENKTAKELGTWMFSDDKMLSRHPTSGAIKHTWLGDIVPVKQLPKNWKKWPFYIECKSGYSNSVCTLTNQNILRKWLNKSLGECSDNYILLLIVKFSNRSTFMLTNYNLKISPYLYLVENKKLYGIYDYADILIHDFKTIFNWE